MPTTLQIPIPCAQQWQTMQPLRPDCRFCAACLKNIVDFTYKTDAEILHYLQQNTGNICGRFRPEQLDRHLKAPKAPRQTGFGAMAAGFAALLAMKEPSIQQISTLPALHAPAVNLSSKTEDPARSTAQDSMRIIAGKVVDMETGEALIGSVVTIDGTSWGAGTDTDGRFSIRIPIQELPQKPLTLRIFYTGYPTLEIVCPERVLTEDIALVPIALDARAVAVMGEVVICHPPKPTMKQRLRRFFRPNR